MKRPALRAGCPVLLEFMARRKTRYVRFANSAQTVAASQFTKRASRAAMNPALLGASRSRRSPHPHSPLQQPGLALGPKARMVDERQAVHGAGAMWGAEQRRLEGGARSALR